MSGTKPVIQISIQRMVCTACGAEANASCNCGVNYAPKSVRAAEAVKANPEKSDRAIAAEIGVDHKTVGKAHQTTGESSPVGRTGLDGKTRKVPAKRKHVEVEVDEQDQDEPEGEDVSEDYVRLVSDYRKLKDRNRILTAALNAKEIEASRNWPADMTPKQIKLRDKCLRAIASWQRDLEQLYGEVTGCPSWRVEAITKDGVRTGNGVRFGTRGEAEFYRTHYAARELDCASSEVIACKDEKANVSVDGDTVRFDHGCCVLFGWQALADAVPISDDAHRNPEDLSIPEFMRRAAHP